MDKSEHLAGLVISSAQVFIEKRMAPIVEGLAGLRRDAGAFFTKDDAAKLITDAGATERRIAAMADTIAILSAELAARPTLQMIRAEQATAAKQAAAELFATMRQPEDGKSVTLDEVRPLIEQLVAAVPAPKDGVDAKVDYKTIREHIDASVAVAIEGIPKPKDAAEVDYDRIGKAIEEVVAALPKAKDGDPGQSVTLDDVRPLVAVTVEAEVGKAVAGIRVPEDGKSVTLDDVAPIISAGLARIQIPKDGKDGTSIEPTEVKAMVDAEVARAVALIPPPEPGRPGMDADLTLLNELVAMSVKAAFADIPRPKDGEDGEDAQPVDMAVVERMIAGQVASMLAQWPRPKDGVDGLGFDDMSMDLKEDGRTMVYKYVRGDREKAFEILAPWQIYRGVYVKGQRYQRGDGVTYAGSQFTAKCDTSKEPGTDDWILSVKRGKDSA